MKILRNLAWLCFTTIMGDRRCVAAICAAGSVCHSISESAWSLARGRSPVGRALLLQQRLASPPSASAVTLYPIDLASPRIRRRFRWAPSLYQSGSTAYAFSGGNTWTFGAVALTARTTVWHAVKPDGVKGGVCGGGTANYPFSPASSDLPNGKLVFASVQTRLRCTISSWMG